jgi:integrase
MSRKVTFRFVWDKFVLLSLHDSKCTPKHIQETELHLKRWEEFWRSKGKEIKVQKCERKHLERYRRHLMDMGKYKPRSINKQLGSIRTILVASAKNGLLKRRPMLEQLPDTTLDPARKIYLRDEQIDSLMEKTDCLTWPPKSFTRIEPATFWRCAIVLYRTYGFRPQELLSYDRKKTPIVWGNISFAKESPNPSSDSQNEFGWLCYVPPKTKRKKPHPLYLPLTEHAHAALRSIEATRISPDAPLLPMPCSQTGFLNQWYAWFESADVKPKIDGERFRPYCLRKTCATHMSAHKTGLASAVCRWGSSGEAGVATEHYIGSDNIIKFLLTAPMPKSFDSFLRN